MGLHRFVAVGALNYVGRRQCITGASFMGARL